MTGGYGNKLKIGTALGRWVGGAGVNKGGGAHFPSGHRLLKAKEPPQNLTDGVHGQTHSAAVRKTHLCFIYVEGRI